MDRDKSRGYSRDYRDGNGRPNDEQYRGQRGRHHEPSSSRDTIGGNPFSDDTNGKSRRGYESGEKYDKGNGRYDYNGGSDRGRGHPRSGAHDRDGGHDRGEGRDRGGGYNRGGGYDRGRGYDRSEAHGRNGGHDSSKVYDGGETSHGNKRPREEAIPRSSKHQRINDEAGPSSSDVKKEPTNDDKHKRVDRYEICRTVPETYITKKGTSGEPLELIANCFKFIKRPLWELVQYRVDFNPECELVKTRKYLMYTQRAFLGGYLYDTKHSVYLTRKLPQDNTVIDAQDRESNNIQITFKFSCIIAMDTRESLQVLNLILRRAMDGLNLQLVGRNLFDAAARISIPEFNLQVWPGYTTSIRQHEKDILLCVEIASKIMRNETMYDLLHQAGPDFKTIFTEQALGMIVLTDYNNKTYRITDVSYDKSPSDTFETKEWGTVSFVQYYKRKYNITIHNTTQPLLISRSTERQLRGGKSELVSLVPELCRPTGLSERQKTNFQLMKNISRHTRMDPVTRMKKLREFNARLSSTPASVEILQTWNFELDRNLIQVPGRALKNENIVFGDNVREMTTQRNADWQFRNKQMYLSYELQNWTILTPYRIEQQVHSFVQTIMRIARDMNYTIGRPKVITLNDDKNAAYVTGFGDAIRSDPQLVMAVVPNNNADRYANIKKMGCVTYGIPTQVIVQKTLNNKGIMSIATKMLLQLNCKLGGAPWLIEMPTRGLMAVGIDVSRDSKDKDVVWGALVATMDLKNIQAESFYSTVTRHMNSEEFSTQLGLNMTKALRCYQDMYGVLPEKICIYRDGVGEGQTKYVYEHEVNQIKEKLEKIYSQAGLENKLKLAFIIVSKRINTRIFTRSDNPPPGTIVDDIITLPERYDFYLVSQSVRQGTVSPTSYNILYDSMGFSADRLQQLTYKQTHLYYNWTGTVRVPAVCQYAHKLTFLVAQCLHSVPLSKLDNKLYFL